MKALTKLLISLLLLAGGAFGQVLGGSATLGGRAVLKRASATPPIAPDASSVSSLCGPGVTTCNWLHTVSGSNRILFVGAFSDTGSNLVTGITYDSVAMAQVPTVSPI